MSNVQNAKPAALRLSFRYEVTPADRIPVREAVESTGFFSDAETEVALELVDERLAKGASSGYHFVLAEGAGRMLGFACYGPIPATAASFDLYWIVVGKSHQGEGVGRTLLAESERRVLASGGRRVYVDTSSRPQYGPTRAFYERNGYRRAAVLEDFYAPGDGKVIYVKVLPEMAAVGGGQ